MNDLKNKIDQVKDGHAAEIVDQRAEEYRELKAKDTLFFLGRVRQNEHLAVAISTNLTAQTIRALEHFQQDKMFETLGYATFVDFLDKSEYSPMTKRQYYDRLALLREHGDEIYDLLTSVGISVRAQKLLGTGDLAIRGDRLVIGDQEVDVKNTGVIKEVLEELFDERRQLQTDLVKAQSKIENQKSQIEVGQRDYDELQRNLDALKQSNPYERGLARAITEMLELTETIGQLPDNQKAKRGTDAMPLLWEAIRRVRAAYGTNFNFSEAAPDSALQTPDSDLDAIAAEVLSHDDEEDDD